MRLTIAGRHIQLSETAVEYAREKLTRAFDKFFKDPRVSQALSVTIEFSRETRHHRKGDIWKVGASFALPYRKKPFYAEVTSQDIHTSIDLLTEEIMREVQTYKGKSKALMLRGARKVKRELRFDPAARLREKGGRVRDEGD